MKNTKKNLEQLILRKESYIEEELRCLNFLLQNPHEAEEGEIYDRNNRISKLLEEVVDLKNELKLIK